MAKSDGVLKETHFPWLGEKSVGKVRDVYEQRDRLVLITTDRHSSFDRIIAHIPHKGQVLNQLSTFWFEKTDDIVPNHVQAIPDPNAMVVTKTAPVLIESVVRGYITGVTETSLWTLYQNGQRNFGNFTLPEGLRKNQKLEQPVFTPSTKSGAHDRPVTPQEAIDEGIIDAQRLGEIERISLALYLRGAEITARRGYILVDTKYEFGVDEHGVLLLIDEVHTPDSSRYWRASSFEERVAAGEEPESFDKEFLRLWFKEHCDPYHDETLPEAPAELIAEMSQKYVDLFEGVTDETFTAGEQPAHERLARNLEPYAAQ